MQIRMPKWLQSTGGEKPSPASEARKKVRQHTDQLLKQQEAKKEKQKEALPQAS
jgi:hypothetical protein